MSRTLPNLLANLAGTGWLALSSLILAPLYIHLLGIESYALIGFYFVLQAALQIFDFGLGPMLNREMARYLAQPERTSSVRAFVRKLEFGYWALGILIGGCIWILTPFIANSWFEAASLSKSVIQQCLYLVAVITAVQWPITLYESGLIGLQRQVRLNSLQIMMITLRSLGVVLVLLFIAPDIRLYFVWQLIFSIFQLVTLRVTFWRCLPPSTRAAQINDGGFRAAWRFALGMSGVNIAGLLLLQFDKIVLSWSLALEEFGYYVLATSVASALIVIIASVFNTTFPRFSALSAKDLPEQSRLFYHQSSQLMAVLVLPVGVTLACFANELIALWLRDDSVTVAVAPIAQLLIIGTMLYGLRYVSFTVQLASGWTSLAFWLNLLLALFYLPAIFLLGQDYGAKGAASAWICLNLIYLIVSVILTHRRFSLGGTGWWFIKDVCPAMIVSILVALLGRGLLANQSNVVVALIGCPVLCLTAMGLSILATRDIRLWLKQQLVSFRSSAAL